MVYLATIAVGHSMDKSERPRSLLGFEFGWTSTRISFISVLYQHFSLQVFKISGWSILN